MLSKSYGLFKATLSETNEWIFFILDVPFLNGFTLRTEKVLKILKKSLK